MQTDNGNSNQSVLGCILNCLRNRRPGNVSAGPRELKVETAGLFVCNTTKKQTKENELEYAQNQPMENSE